MLMLILQTLLLIAIAFVLGCIAGCLLRRLYGADSNLPVRQTDDSAVVATTVAAASEPPPPAPAPAKREVVDPEPVARAVTKPKAPKAKRNSPTRKMPVRKPASAKAAAVSAVPAKSDDLKQIKGISSVIEAKLNAIGVSTFNQIAKWTAKDRNEFNEKLSFSGRIEREEWVEQAKILAKGRKTAFAKRVAKGEVESSTGKMPVAGLGKKPRVLKNPRRGKADNLTLIDGVGNAIEEKLFDIGVYHFDQIARWNAEQAEWIGNEIGFPGRVERENWIKEAATLARGGTTAHAKRVEAGKVETSHKSTTAQKGRRTKK